MANYKAVANGNWSNLAIWQDNSTGVFLASTVLPGASDDVYSNTFTVTINQNITVASLRNTAATGISQSGNIAFQVTTSRSITCTDMGLVTLNGPSQLLLVNAINVTLTLVANVYSQNNGGGGTDYAISAVSGNVVINHTGNVYYLLTTTGFGVGKVIQIANTNTYNFIGNIYGNGLSQRLVLFHLNGATANLNITGNLFVGACVGIDSNGGNVDLVGDISVSSLTNAICPFAIGGGGGPMNLIFSGNITTTTQFTISFDSMRVHPTGNISWQFLTTNPGVFRTLYTPGVATGHPATNNVRTGIVYGPTNNLTGTCAVPPAAAVSLGVPVDNTVGTASLDANALAAALNTSLSASLPTPISASLQASLPTPISASLQASLPTPIATALNTSLSASLPAAIAPLLWDESVTNITTPNSIGERLKNCSTVATTGAQIASFNP
jgi:hypothetical protein